MDKMLAWKPEDRITVDEALKHPYLATYHNPLEEPFCTPFDHAFEERTENLESLRGSPSSALTGALNYFFLRSTSLFSVALIFEEMCYKKQDLLQDVAAPPQIPQQAPAHDPSALPTEGFK